LSKPTSGNNHEAAGKVQGLGLPALSIKRHVFAYMLSGVLLLFGIISYDRIGVDRFPRIEFPMISVQTVLPGASPEIMDAKRARYRAHSHYFCSGYFRFGDPLWP